MKLNHEQTKQMLYSPQTSFFDGKEKEYEEYIAECLDDICENMGLPPIKKVIRQKRYNFETFSIKPDIIAIHEDMTYSVFEIKCVNAKYPGTAPSEQCRAIGQLLLYKSVLKEKHNGASPRMFLVDQKIAPRTVCVFSDMKLPITLLEVGKDYVFIPYMMHEN